MKAFLQVLSLFLALTGAGAWAASSGPAPLSDGQFLQGRFTLDRHLAGFDTPLASEGWFFAGRRHGLVWATTAPVENVTVVGNGTLRQIDAAGNEVTKGSVGMARVVGALSGVLTGDFSGLQDSFTVKTQEDEDAWTAVLHPKNSDVASRLTEIRAAGATYVTKVIVYKTGGDYDVIRLRDQTVGTGARPHKVKPYFE